MAETKPSRSPGLWTRNFSLYTISTLISAIGGIGLNTALGLLTYKETGSTLLSAIFIALSFLPQFLVPIMISPVIDRHNPLKLLVRNEIVLAVVYFAMAAATWYFGFIYVVCLGFSLVISTLGTISQLASDSILPQVMPVENYSKGNAVISMIWPLCSIIMVPTAITLFTNYGIAVIMAGMGVCGTLDAFVGSRIKTKFAYKTDGQSPGLKAYLSDVREGLAFLRGEPAIRSVFIFFTIMELSNAAFNILIYPHFNIDPSLNNNQYMILMMVTSLGYLAGGAIQYFGNIPPKARFGLAIGVYTMFGLLDGTLFLMPLWMMCAARFFLGILGANSANIRISAVQARVPNQLRAKVNALFMIMLSVSAPISQLIVGSLGEVLPFWIIAAGANLTLLLAMFALIVPPRFKVRELYGFAAPQKAEPAMADAE